MHHRQLIGCKMIDDRTDAGDRLAIGEIDLDTDLGETLHRPRPHASDDNRVDAGIVEDPDRNHASARLVRPVHHRLDRGDGVVVIKIDHGKDLAMPEMIGSYGIQPAGRSVGIATRIFILLLIKLSMLFGCAYAHLIVYMHM